MQFDLESMFTWLSNIDTTEETIGLIIFVLAIQLISLFAYEGLNKCCKSKRAAPEVDIEMQTPPRRRTHRHRRHRH